MKALAARKAREMTVKPSVATIGRVVRKAPMLSALSTLSRNTGHVIVQTYAKSKVIKL